MWTLESISCTLFLIVCSVIDMRYKKLPVAIFIVAAAGSIVLIMLGNADSILAAGGALIGVFCLFFSRVTREGLGYGDSLLILCLGIVIGLWQIIAVLLTAFFSAAVYSAFLLAIRHRGRGYTYPFVPFLLIGYMGVLWL